MGNMKYNEWRSHFNAWCIVSSPLILSHDLTNDAISTTIWPIITNTEALAVSSAYYGFSGSTFKSASETIEAGRAPRVLSAAPAVPRLPTA